MSQNFSFFIANAQAEDTPVAVPGGTTSATGTADTTAAPAAPGFGSMLVPLGLMFVVMYFLVMRPNQKRMKLHQEMIKAVKEGDEVLLASGMIGTIDSFNDKIVTLKIDRDVRVKVLKSQIAKVLTGGETPELPAGAGAGATT